MRSRTGYSASGEDSAQEPGLTPTSHSTRLNTASLPPELSPPHVLPNRHLGRRWSTFRPSSLSSDCVDYPRGHRPPGYDVPEPFLAKSRSPTRPPHPLALHPRPVESLRQCRPPPNRQKAVTPRLLRGMHAWATKFGRNSLEAVVSNLAILAFFFAMCSGEFVSVPIPGRTKLLSVRSLQFWDSNHLPLPYNSTKLASLPGHPNLSHLHSSKECHQKLC